MKTIVFTLSDDYFFDIFHPVYQELKKYKGLEVFFMYSSQGYGIAWKDKIVKYLLERGVSEDYIIPSRDNSIVPDMVISAEMHPTISLPESCKEAIKVQMYHGVDTHDFISNLENLSKYDTHLSIGPQFNAYFNTLKKVNATVQIYNVGFPKTDELFFHNKTNNKQRIIAYIPHWKHYASLHVFKRNIVDVLCADPNNTIIICPHNHLFIQGNRDEWLTLFSELSATYSNLLVYYIADNNQHYKCADLIITDLNSSSSLEGNITGVPVITYIGAKNQIEPTRNDLIDRIIETNYTFNSLHQLDDLLSSKDLQPKPIAQTLLDDHLYNHGSATLAAVKIILEKLLLCNTI
ncbi:hypothetical protein N9955_00025 [bacterium]|nr:hypothetical protein [bacterium]